MHRIKSFTVLRTSATIGVVLFLFVLILSLLAGLVAGVSPVIPHHVGAQVVAPFQPLRRRFFVALPFIEGVAGFLSTGLFCWLYNLSSRFTGGIEVNAVRTPESRAETNHEQVR